LDALLLIGAVAVEVVLIIIALRRFGFAPLPGLALIYFLVAQISLTLVYNDLAFNAFMESYSRGGVYTYYFQTMMLYFAASILMAASFWKGMFRSGAQRVGSIHVDITRFAKVMPMINAAVGALTGIVLIVFAMVADWEMIWSNYTYLSMTRADVITVPSFAILPNLLPLFAIVTAVLGAINLAMRRPIPAIFFNVIWVAISLYFLASHQRVAIVPPAAMVVVLSIVSTGSHPIAKILTITYTVLAYAVALTGRGRTAHHGLSSLFEVSDQFSGFGLFDLATKLLLNVSEGAFVVAEGFARAASYPPIYKILSFSPLPSFIDKFSEINRLYQVRLSPYAPFSGITEAYFFGPAYLTALIVIYLGAFWIYRRVTERNRYLGLAIGLLVLLATVQVFAYPLRNSLKPLWMGVVIGVVALVYLPKPKAVQQISPQLRATLMGGANPPPRRAGVPQGGVLVRPMARQQRRQPIRRG
jgi:hypothetical protein